MITSGKLNEHNQVEIKVLTHIVITILSDIIIEEHAKSSYSLLTLLVTLVKQKFNKLNYIEDVYKLIHFPNYFYMQLALIINSYASWRHKFKFIQINFAKLLAR